MTSLKHLIGRGKKFWSRIFHTFDEGKMIGFFLQQMTQQRAQVPPADLPSFDLLSQTLEARRLEATEKK